MGKWSGEGEGWFCLFFCGFFVWAFEGLLVLVFGLWVLVGLEAGTLGGFPAGVGRFVKVVFGGGAKQLPISV